MTDTTCPRCQDYERVLRALVEEAETVIGLMEAKADGIVANPDSERLRLTDAAHAARAALPERP